MVFVVEDVKKVAIERMDVIESWKLVDDCGEFFVKVCLCEFDFAHVELSDAVDCVAFVDYGRGLSLGSTEDYVDKIFPGWYPCDLFEVILHHGWMFLCKNRNRVVEQIGRAHV